MTTYPFSLPSSFRVFSSYLEYSILQRQFTKFPYIQIKNVAKHLVQYYQYCDQGKGRLFRSLSYLTVCKSESRHTPTTVPQTHSEKMDYVKNIVS